MPPFRPGSSAPRSRCSRPSRWEGPATTTAPRPSARSLEPRGWRGTGPHGRTSGSKGLVPCRTCRRSSPTATGSHGTPTRRSTWAITFVAVGSSSSSTSARSDSPTPTRLRRPTAAIGVAIESLLLSVGGPAAYRFPAQRTRCGRTCVCATIAKPTIGPTRYRSSAVALVGNGPSDGPRPPPLPRAAAQSPFGPPRALTATDEHPNRATSRRHGWLARGDP